MLECGPPFPCEESPRAPHLRFKILFMVVSSEINAVSFMERIKQVNSVVTTDAEVFSNASLRFDLARLDAEVLNQEFSHSGK